MGSKHLPAQVLRLGWGSRVHADGGLEPVLSGEAVAAYFHGLV